MHIFMIIAAITIGWGFTQGNFGEDQYNNYEQRSVWAKNKDR